MGVEPFRPRSRHDFYKVVVAFFVFCEKYEVASGVMLVGVYVKSLVGHIHLASQYGFEDLAPEFFSFRAFFFSQCRVSCRFRFFGCSLRILDSSLGLGVFLGHVVVKLLYGEHVAMVGDGDRGHSVGHGLVYKRLDGCLSVKYGVLCLYVKMNESAHVYVYIMGKRTGLFLVRHAYDEAMSKVGIFFVICHTLKIGVLLTRSVSQP